MCVDLEICVDIEICVEKEKVLSVYATAESTFSTV